MLRSGAAFLACFGMTGCASGPVSPALGYVSALRVEPIALTVDVEVTMAPGSLPAQFRERQTEILDSLQIAATKDIEKNGPFTIATENPDATLALQIQLLKEYHDYGVAAPGFGRSIFYSSVPPFLGWLIWPTVGMATALHEMSATVRARLVAQDGTVLAETEGHAECEELSGLYTDEVTFECAAQKMMEKVRASFSSQSKTILANKRRRDSETLASTTLQASAKMNAERVIAVMDVEPSSALAREHEIDGELLRDLVDQLRVMVAQHGARTIDRSAQDRALRQQISNLKQESYDSCYAETCQIELGKALAASHILRSQLKRFGKRCVLSAELVDLKSEVTMAASSAQGECEPEGLLIMSDAVASALVTR